jgi:hypothetical protein
MKRPVYSDTSWWWAVTCPKHVEVNDEINRGQTVHQVYFYCTDLSSNLQNKILYSQNSDY